MHEPAGGNDPTVDRTGRRSGLGSRRVLWGAIAISAALHAFFIAIYPLFVRAIQPGALALPLTSSAAKPGGMQVIRLVEVDAVPDAARPEQPIRIAPVEAANPDLEGPNVGEEPSIELEGFGETAAERLRPHLSDPRLWAPLPPEFTELSLEQREELLVAGRLEEWNDSVAAAVAAATPNWAFTDSKGRQWGIADGKLHLGSIAIPIPSFAAPAGPDRDYLRQFDEMARQSANAQTQQTVRERLEAIRERRDRERAEQHTDSTGTPN